MSYAKSKVEQLLRAEVGFHEYGGNGDGNGNPYSKWQYNVEYPDGGWCMSFASQIAYRAGFRFDSGATFGDKGFSSTNAAEPWARARGLWRDRNWRAQVGDWIIFQWDGGGTDHGEVVVYDDGVRIITIGGNTGNAVRWRTRDRRLVQGFVALSASAQAAPPLPSPATLVYLAKLAEWEESMKAEPVRFGDPASGKITLLNRLLVDAGMMIAPKNWNFYGVTTRDGVLHVKDLLGDEKPNGKEAGGRVAHWLIHRGK